MEGCAITLAVEPSVSAVNLDEPSSASVLQLRFVKEITPHHTVPKMDHLLLGLEKCGDDWRWEFGEKQPFHQLDGMNHLGFAFCLAPLPLRSSTVNEKVRLGLCC